MPPRVGATSVDGIEAKLVDQAEYRLSGGERILSDGERLRGLRSALVRQTVPGDVVEGIVDGAGRLPARADRLMGEVDTRPLGEDRAERGSV
jgi:hypothetical protein